ncbi:hypothetical protein G7K_1947-t1 [Saitoella complicata NRRL Y-17804]|uniref:Uncharacterized protein n=2 Tax=Saitoella complicata (strain BCRC 22490 / CBS 7301 / JCM 7358 / NBRC 10748 / NRRL Y-17804) TaxID=698492 RepID=A0A0E9ND69_SAICN|nr:hypothetical protein G7K_1947-t1 [Saitoella complicata NRRL Y-17804]
MVRVLSLPTLSILLNQQLPYLIFSTSKTHTRSPTAQEIFGLELALVSAAPYKPVLRTYTSIETLADSKGPKCPNNTFKDAKAAKAREDQYRDEVAVPDLADWDWLSQQQVLHITYDPEYRKVYQNWIIEMAEANAKELLNTGQAESGFTVIRIGRPTQAPPRIFV